MIRFTAPVDTINTWNIVRLPKTASTQLPSRGQVFVDGKINGEQFQAPLEPDGDGSHWFKLDAHLKNKLAVKPGDQLNLEIAPVKEWPNPDIPKDLQTALKTSPQAKAVWEKITPMARWEWVRWSRSTNNVETRKRRVEVAMSKLSKGERRPCCWNRNLCTEPSVSKNGVLLPTS